MQTTPRRVERKDIIALKSVLNKVELFPPEMFDDMISDFFENPNTQDYWFTQEVEGRCVSLAYCAPEQLNNRTYNLLALGVDPDIQGKGLGKLMVNFIEAHLKEAGHRLLIIDTSSLPDFESSRRFYETLGYKKEAVIRDYWAEGDHKITYRKRL